MKTFRQFLRRLESLRWEHSGLFDPDVLAVLAEVGRQPRLVHDAVSSWSLNGLDKRQLSCHETATHYKWFLYYHKSRRFKVWLHQYKTCGERRLGYAEVPHNHRYSLASVILNGGFIHHDFERSGGVLTESVNSRQSYGQGDAYMVAWQQIHKLSDIHDQTFTLVVESPTVRHFSEAYYTESTEPRMFYDFVGLRPRLEDSMRLMENARLDERSEDKWRKAGP